MNFFVCGPASSSEALRFATGTGALGTGAPATIYEDMNKNKKTIVFIRITYF